MSVQNKDFNLLEIVSNAVKEMSEGELLQIEKARHLDITEDVYFDIIRQKTASLISSCCAVGASSAGVENGAIEDMRVFGEKVGLAFQIKDDLFDYGDNEIGKPLGIDIKERKMTLPLIYTLGKASKSERRNMMNIIKNHNDKPARVKEVIKFVIDSGGIDYAHEAMMKYYREALDLLGKFKESEYRNSLEELVTFTIERKK